MLAFVNVACICGIPESTYVITWFDIILLAAAALLILSTLAVTGYTISRASDLHIVLRSSQPRVALRDARQTRLGHNPLAHLRPGMHRVPEGHGFPAGTFSKVKDPDADRTVEEVEGTIRKAVRRSLRPSPTRE